jgi:hypothetical protein
MFAALRTVLHLHSQAFLDAITTETVQTLQATKKMISTPKKTVPH